MTSRVIRCEMSHIEKIFAKDRITKLGKKASWAKNVLQRPKHRMNGNILQFFVGRLT